MLKLDSTISTLLIAAGVATAIGLFAEPKLFRNGTSPQGSGGAIAQSEGAKPKAQWAASATGRIEPKDGEVRILAPAAAKIIAVPVKTNDRVSKGDILVRLDDEDLMTKIDAGEIEAQVRKRERDEEVATGLALERRKAEDSLYTAERAFFRARLALDEAVTRWRNGNGTEQEANEARARQAQAENAANIERTALARTNAKANMPLPTRLESSLATARAELQLAEAAVDRAHVRAPYAGTALNVLARVGETAVPSPEQPLLYFGDVSSMRVRAEVEERDVPKVRIGQQVVVRADAYPDKEFTGTVTSVSQALAAPRMNSRGPRRPNDVEVLEVLAQLDGTPPLLTGMRVDVYFRLDATAASKPAAAAAATSN